MAGPTDGSQCDARRLPERAATGCLYNRPAVCGAALVADDLVSIAFTDKWQPMVPLLRVLCVFGLIRSLDVLLPPVLFARYRTAFLFGWTVVLLLVMPFAFLTGAVSFGAAGVALALIVVYPIIMAWMAREALRELASA